VAVDVREPELRGAEALQAAYEAKAAAELTDADALIGAGPGSWEGPLVGARIAFLTSRAASRAGAAPLLGDRVAGAVSKAAAALGAGDDVFVLITRPVKASAAAVARRVRLAIEAADPPAVVALDEGAAADLAAAFGLEPLRVGMPVSVLGRTVGSVGDFAASLDDKSAKARAWSEMKAIAAGAGIEVKERPKALLKKNT
jgi:hypothetical protein